MIPVGPQLPCLKQHLLSAKASQVQVLQELQDQRDCIYAILRRRGMGRLRFHPDKELIFMILIRLKGKCPLRGAGPGNSLLELCLVYARQDHSPLPRDNIGRIAGLDPYHAHVPGLSGLRFIRPAGAEFSLQPPLLNMDQWVTRVRGNGIQRFLFPAVIILQIS